MELVVWFVAHKVTEMRKGSEEVNVSYADPDNQSCLYLQKDAFHNIFILFARCVDQWSSRSGS